MGLTRQERMIRALEGRKRGYEKFFKDRVLEGKDKDPDHKAESAYAGIVKTIFDMSRKAEEAEGRVSGEERRVMAEEIFRNEFGVGR